MGSKKIAYVIAPEGFNDDEMLKPKAILEDNDVEVVIVSTEVQECRGMRGTRIRSSVAIREVSPKDYDGIVVVGGAGALRYLSENEDLINLLRAFNNEGKLVSAIGRGRHALHNAGLFGTNFAWGPKVEINDNVIAARPPSTTSGWTSEEYGYLLVEHLCRRKEN